MANLPDFIVIGAGKAGTTSLHRYLQQHPEVYLCPKKETFYFINEQARKNHAPWGAVQTLEAYQTLFSEAPADSVIGEISTNYYAYPESASLIHQVLPEVKILAILRNPIERAFSAYQMHVNDGVEKRAFKDTIDAEMKYVKRGFYYAQILPYYDVFDASQIQILLFDDYCQNAVSFMQSIFEFIGVNSQFVPNTSQKARVGGVPKRRWLKQLIDGKNPVRTTVAAVLKPMMPLETRQKLRSQILKRNTVRLQMDAESYQKLADLYQKDVEQLQTLLGRDLSHWLQLPPQLN